MYSIMIMGFLSALGAFILVCKINIDKACEFHWQLDMLFAVLVTWLFFGTFSGMATAAVAGVTFSALLFIAKLVND